MRLAMTTLCALLLLAGGLAGCTAPEENEVPMDDGTIAEPAPEAEEGMAGDAMGGRDDMDEGDRTDQLFLEGELTDEGVECPAFRGDDGELYTLTGDMAGFQPGDRVRIVGTLVEVSICMQGTTVEIVEISAVEEEGE